MMIFFGIVAFSCSLLLFLHLIRLKENIQMSISKRNGKSNGKSNGKDDSSKMSSNSQSSSFQPKALTRSCPLCNSLLLNDEYLMCGMGPELGGGQKRQVQIYGCKNCFVAGGVNVEIQKIKI